ncbi:MAG TPA: Lsr2 family protein [Actinocrinis sp.]|nr:Lsr2 family protein [Actinocrinis sp.]
MACRAKGTVVAQKTVVVMTDDLTGGDATQTIHFSLDSSEYVIDLNDKNAAALRADFEKYIEAGRKHKAEAGAAARARRGAAARPASGVDTAAVREWARANGHEVSERGRVSKKIIEAYLQAG